MYNLQANKVVAATSLSGGETDGAKLRAIMKNEKNCYRLQSPKNRGEVLLPLDLQTLTHSQNYDGMTGVCVWVC